MKKFFGIALIVLVAFVFATNVYAGGGRGCGGGYRPAPCRPGWGGGCRPRPCPPRPCGPGYGYGCGYRYNCSRDLGNAAAICDIVASGLSMAASVCQPAVVAAPVAPVVQPTVAAPVVAPAPVAQPVISNYGRYASSYYYGCN